MPPLYVVPLHSSRLPLSFPYLSKDHFYGDPNSMRGMKETMIRSAAIQVVATASYGHLMSLRNMSNKSSPLLLYLLGSIIFPLLPIAQLLRSSRSIVATAYRTRSFQMRFYASACLGMHGTLCHRDSITKPILNFDLSRLLPTRMRYNILWVGRMLILLALLVQFTGTVVLWIRRASTYIAMFRLWAIDNRNLEVAIPGMLVVLISIGILTLNTKWNIVEDMPQPSPGSSEAQNSGDISAGDMQESPREVPATSESFTVIDSSGPRVVSVTDSFALISRISLGHSARNNTFHRLLFNIENPKWMAEWRAARTCIKFFYVTFKRVNTSLSNWTLRYYPLEFQWDFELAYLLHMILYAFIPKDGNQFYRGYGWQPLWKLKYYFAFKVLLQFRKVPDIEITPQFENDLLHEKVVAVFMTFYYLPCFVILLGNMIWAVSRPAILRYIPGSCKVICHEIDFWLRSGRTIFSLPISFLLFLPILLQAYMLRESFLDIKYVERRFQEDGISHPPPVILWKDPWADQMYII